MTTHILRTKINTYCGKVKPKYSTRGYTKANCTSCLIAYIRKLNAGPAPYNDIYQLNPPFYKQNPVASTRTYSNGDILDFRSTECDCSEPSERF